jgi:hypothetical protein
MADVSKPILLCFKPNAPTVVSLRRHHNPHFRNLYALEAYARIGGTVRNERAAAVLEPEAL